ncbi:ABC transporter permease subunit [uncultured Victivallis sp.]|uniref:ABC transporter permease subunit n=1 Tax=uncultured Victivallis sp. TaxID=354118 RepID=UPI002583E846|nr:ABC transporter permease subunit [uncultured Victivallis sp.]
MLRSLCHELVKLRIQKKNYVMLGGHLLFLGLCYLAFRSAQGNFFRRFDKTMNFHVEDLTSYLEGLFFARIAMVPTFIVLMPIVVATLAGDCVAGEMQEGSLKLYVSRPRSRSRIILSKFFAVYLATLLYCLYFAALNIAIGVLVLNISPTQLVMLTDRVFGTDVVIMGVRGALLRYFAATVYFSFSLTALGAITLFFSTVFNRMSAATVTVISFYFVSYVIAALPFSESIRPYLLSEVMNNSFLLWLSPLPVNKLLVNLSTLSLYTVGFLLLATLMFNYKDLK